MKGYHNMIDIISEMFSKYGTLGIVIPLVFYFIKNNPITSISASAIEMKLATKEKRFYVRMLKHTLSIVIYVTFLMAITGTFFVDKNLYSSKVFNTYSLISVVVFFWIIILDTKDKTFSDLVSGWKIILKWIFFMLLLIHFISIFVAAAYYFGTQLYSETLESTVSDVEKYTIIVGIVIIYIFISIALHFTVIDTYLRFLEFKDNNKYTLIVNIENEKWFLFHPIDKDVYLLGNKATLNECSKFSFIERKELLMKTIVIES